MRYIEGTRVQHRDGHIYIKTREYGLVKEARFLAALNEGRDLDKNERVFFRDGNRENVKRENVVPIHFNETRFKYLPHARILFIPSRHREKVAT
jgi:hypothetical protein